MIDLDSPSGAIFSDDDDHRYRYLLWRNWAPNNQRRLLWVMLNPSTADAEHDDPSLASCKRISENWGYDGLVVVNLFAYRTANPQDLRFTCNPVGIENDDCLELIARQATEIVVAWGEQGAYRDRDCEVLSLLSKYKPHPLLCLGHVQNDCPRHPLYMPQDSQRQPYLGYRKRCP